MLESDKKPSSLAELSENSFEFHGKKACAVLFSCYLIKLLAEC